MTVSIRQAERDRRAVAHYNCPHPGCREHAGKACLGKYGKRMARPHQARVALVPDWAPGEPCLVFIPYSHGAVKSDLPLSWWRERGHELPDESAYHELAKGTYFAILGSGDFVLPGAPGLCQRGALVLVRNTVSARLEAYADSNKACIVMVAKAALPRARGLREQERHHHRGGSGRARDHAGRLLQQRAGEVAARLIQPFRHGLGREVSR